VFTYHFMVNKTGVQHCSVWHLLSWQTCAHRWCLITKLLVGHVTARLIIYPTPSIATPTILLAYSSDVKTGLLHPRLFRVHPNCFDVAFGYSHIRPPRFTSRTSYPSAPNYLVSQFSLNITCRLYSLIICYAHAVKTTPLNFPRTHRQGLFCAPLHIVRLFH